MDGTQYGIAQIVIIGVTAVTSLIISICAKAVTKINKDPARHWIQALRGALGALWVSGLFCCIVLGLNISNYEWWDYNSLRRFYYVLSALIDVFLTLAHVLTFSMFTDFAAGLSFLKNGVINKNVRSAQIATSIVGGIIILLTIVAMALRLAVNFSNTSDMYFNLIPHVLRIDAGIAIIFLLWCVLAVGVAIGAMVRYKDVPNARKPSGFFLGATITNMIPHVYLIAYKAQWGSFDGSVRRTTLYDGPPEALWIVGPLLIWIPTLVVLIVMFALAAKKNPGMWTVAQPMSGPQYVYQPQQWYGQPQQPYAQPQQAYAQPQQYGQYNGDYQQNGWQQQQQQPMASPQYDQRASQQWSQPVAQNHVMETK